MLVLRTLTLGLVVATLWMTLLWVTRKEPSWYEGPRPAVVRAPAPPIANPIMVIDLAALPSGQRALRAVADLVRLAPTEQIIAVNDRPVTVSDACQAAPQYCMGAMIGGGYVEGAGYMVDAGSYVDFTVASPTASRRVLVLVH